MANKYIIAVFIFLFTGCDSIRIILDEQDENVIKSDCVWFDINFINGIGSKSYIIQLNIYKGEIIYPRNFKVTVDDSLIKNYSINKWDVPLIDDSVSIGNEVVNFSYGFTAKSYFEANKFTLHFGHLFKCNNEFINIDSLTVFKND
ncbi:MAG: hypothetical protein WC967_15390 [Balneolaceae bacterium]